MVRDSHEALVAAIHYRRRPSDKTQCVLAATSWNIRNCRPHECSGAPQHLERWVGPVEINPHADCVRIASVGDMGPEICGLACHWTAGRAGGVSSRYCPNVRAQIPVGVAVADD